MYRQELSRLDLQICTELVVPSEVEQILYHPVMWKNAGLQCKTILQFKIPTHRPTSLMLMSVLQSHFNMSSTVISDKCIQYMKQD